MSTEPKMPIRDQYVALAVGIDGWKRETRRMYAGTKNVKGWGKNLHLHLGDNQRDFVPEGCKHLLCKPEDLNDVHRMEMNLPRELIPEWERHVRQITLRDAEEGTGLYERIIRATAQQRVEALLRTIGKWKPATA